MTLPPPPSFSSFPDVSAPKDEKKEHKKKDRDKEKHRFKHKSSSHKHHVARSRKSSSPSAPAEKEEKTTAVKGIYFIDKVGDLDNLRFQRNDKSKISRFKRSGYGMVLGLNKGLRISRDSKYAGTGLIVMPRNAFNSKRYMNISFYEERKRGRLRVRNRRQATTAHKQDEKQESFIALIDAEQEDAEDGQGPGEEIQPQRSSFYDDMISSALADETMARDNSSNSDPSDSEFERNAESYENRMMREVAVAGEVANKNPTNPDLWIRYLKAQEAALMDPLKQPQNSRRTEAILYELKLRTYKSALKHVDDDRILCGYMDTISEVWESEKVLSKWKDFLEKYPERISVWKGYLNYLQTDGKNFNFDSVVEVYEVCLQSLSRRISENGQDLTKRSAMEHTVVYIFFRLCLMLDQAGYYERAFASFQALIELNFFAPEPGAHFSLKLSALEEFWDSEAPRVGENGAKGWKNSIDHSFNPSEILTADSVDAEGDSYVTWARREKDQVQMKSRPARITAFCSEDDPYRAILFSDVKSFLFEIQNPATKLFLTCIFLAFLGLPVSPPGKSTQSDVLNDDSFIDCHLCTNPLAKQKFWTDYNNRDGKLFDIVGGEPMESVRISGFEDPTSLPFASIPVSMEGLFDSGNKERRWFSVINSQSLGNAKIEVAKEAIILLTSVCSNDFLNLILLSLDSYLNPNSNLPKKILGSHRNHLVLWDGYARRLVSQKKTDAARGVYIQALKMSTTFSDKDKADRVLMWFGLIELEWQTGNYEVSLNIILLYAGVLPEHVTLESVLKIDGIEAHKTSIRMVKASRTLKSQLDSYLQADSPTSQEIDRRKCHAYIYFLYEYFRIQRRETKSVGKCFEEYIRQLPQQNHQNNNEMRDTLNPALSFSEEEEVFMFYSKLLYWHMHSGLGYRPHEVRETLEKAISLYPKNIAFLSLYTHNELRSKIQNRARTLLHDKVLQKENVSSTLWAFAVYFELHMDARRFNPAGVRSLFNKATSSQSTRSSWMLWVLYIEFEIRQENYAAAKSLVYQAFRQCPWVKELYLIAFLPPLRNEFSVLELERIQAVMVEKGLRIVGEISFKELEKETMQSIVMPPDSDDSDVPL